MKEKSDYLLKNVCFLLFSWQNAIVFVMMMLISVNNFIVTICQQICSFAEIRC